MSSESINPNLPPMRERVQAVKQLRQQLGDEQITPEQLAEVGFVSLEEDGVRSYVSYEQLAARSAYKEKGGWRLPETTIDIECPTDFSVGSRINRRDLARRMAGLEDTLIIFPYGDVDYRRYGLDRTKLDESEARIAQFVGVDSPLITVYRRYRELNANRRSEGLSPTVETLFEPLISELFEEQEWRPSEDIRQQGRYDELPELWETQMLLSQLQRVRGIVGDTQELEHRFEHELRIRYGETEDGRETTVIADDITAQTSLWAQMLSENGFSNAAARMQSSQTLKEAQTVMAAALQTNEAKAEAKHAEQDWQLRRKQATEPAAIHALNSERSAIKQALRAKLQPLLGLDMLVNLMRHYQAANLRQIKDIEQALTTKDTSGNVILTLDTKPDAELDADPGKVSGDCTAGENKLVFGRKTGLHNVRVLLGDNHMGNMYLYEGQVGDDEKVWHLDAIQIPHRPVCWREFPPLLIERLAPLAEAAGIDAITINNQQHHVSNYDYVSRGFMEYFGTADNWQAHGQMELLDEGEVSGVAAHQDQLCRVNFDRYKKAVDTNANKLLQGISDEQVYLWRASRS